MASTCTMAVTHVTCTCMVSMSRAPCSINAEKWGKGVLELYSIASTEYGRKVRKAVTCRVGVAKSWPMYAGYKCRLKLAMHTG